MAKDPTVSVTHGADGRVVAVFEVWQRPWTTNAERAGNRYGRASKTKAWRDLFAVMALGNKVPLLSDATVIVELEMKGVLQDTASCNPAVKAAIDGMVDANVFVDDTGDHVSEIVFKAPRRAKQDRLVLTVVGMEQGKAKKL